MWYAYGHQNKKTFMKQWVLNATLSNPQRKYLLKCPKWHYKSCLMSKNIPCFGSCEVKWTLKRSPPSSLSLQVASLIYSSNYTPQLLLTSNPLWADTSTFGLFQKVPVFFFLLCRRFHHLPHQLLVRTIWQQVILYTLSIQVQVCKFQNKFLKGWCFQS
jgi:hypothetical protein